MVLAAVALAALSGSNSLASVISSALTAITNRISTTVS